MENAKNIAQQLAQIPMFKGVSMSDMETLVNMGRKMSFMSGQKIFQQGTVGDSMYIILSGRIRIYFEDAQKNQLVLRHYGSGEIVGEFAILDQQPRSASGAADEPVTTLVVDRKTFLAFLRERPVVGLSMMRNLTERVRYTTQFLESLNEGVLLLAEGNYEDAIRELTSSGADDQLKYLVGDFMNMITQVRERQEKLRKSARASADSDQTKTAPFQNPS
jgi:CRP-like cAMP-binding protein